MRDTAAVAEAEAAAAADSDDAAGEASGGGGGAAVAPAGTAVTGVVRITNSAGALAGVTQAADAVVSNVPRAGTTLGGTRPSAADPGGHPSGLALDHMALSNTTLGIAVVDHHIVNRDEVGIDSSSTGSGSSHAGATWTTSTRTAPDLRLWPRSQCGVGAAPSARALR